MFFCFFCQDNMPYSQFKSIFTSRRLDAYYLLMGNIGGRSHSSDQIIKNILIVLWTANTKLLMLEYTFAPQRILFILNIQHANFAPTDLFLSFYRISNKINLSIKVLQEEALTIL